MFGMQRIGDLVWLAGDMRVKGFMVGGTAGRTTLNGEGLQHEDGHSHLLAYPVPNLEAYDPAFGYEIAVIIREGIRRMYVEQEDVFYYLTVETTSMPCRRCPMAQKKGILKGMYKFKPSAKKRARLKAHSLAAARSSTAPSKHRASSKKNTKSVPMSGASPATRPCTATPSMPSVGTACTPAQNPVSVT